MREYKPPQMPMTERKCMVTFPFELLIERVPSEKQTESLLCKGHLRVIPGRREVYDALWNDRSVVVKVFSRKISARRHLRREWDGLRLLQSRGVNTPDPLFYGQTQDGRWAVVVEKIAGSSTVWDLFHKTQDPVKKVGLLIPVCKELAKQHGKGVLQKDLHLGNFLLDGERILVLDPGQMRFFAQPVTRKRGISQLALLVRCLPADDRESISKVCGEYFEARGWRFRKSDETLLRKQMTMHGKRGTRRGLKKCLRTSKRNLRVKTDRYLAVFERSFCLGAEPLGFIEQIDALMDGGEVLKDGNTCYVCRLTWNGKDVVVKRYNHKGVVHSVRHTIKRSRARQGWLHAQRLGMLHIATPRPLAYIEQLKGLIVWKSYLVTEHVEGQKLDCFLRDENISQEQRSDTTRRVMELLEKLGKYRITHGDLKHSNLLITEDGPVLIDLDAMVVHKIGWISAWKGRTYVSRFKESLEASPVY